MADCVSPGTSFHAVKDLEPQQQDLRREGKGKEMGSRKQGRATRSTDCRAVDRGTGKERRRSHILGLEDYSQGQLR